MRPTKEKLLVVKHLAKSIGFNEQIRQKIIEGRKTLKPFDDPSPDDAKIESFRKARGWNKYFDEDDLRDLYRLIEPRWPSSNKYYSNISDYILWLEALLQYHQGNVWREMTFTAAKVRRHLIKLAQALKTLRKGIEPHSVYLIDLAISSKDDKALASVIQALDSYQYALELRVMGVALDGRPPDGARGRLANLLASSMDSNGLNPTTSDNGVFVEVLRILLTQLGKEGRPDEIRHLVTRAIARMKADRLKAESEREPFWFLPGGPKSYN